MSGARSLSLRARLIASLSYVLVLAIVSLGVPLALSLKDRVNAEVRSQALSQADVVAATAADLLRPVNDSALRAIARTSAASVRGRVLIVDVRGQVLADSAGASTVGVSYASRPELARALKGTAVQVQRHSRSLGQDILATATPVLRGGKAIGAVRVTQSVVAVQRAVASTVAKLALIAGTVLALGLLAGWLIAREVARPLRRLERAARQIEAGELQARAPVEGSSEQRSLARSFNEMASRLQRMLTAQREFVADASHQLRTPLTGLRLRLEEAAAAGVSPAAGRELDAGAAEVDRLAAIVEEMLALSRAEERRADAVAVELGEAVHAAERRWRIAAASREIALRVADEGALAVVCPRESLDRALDALIDNAIRYSPPGSEVTIVAGPSWIEVRDRGLGLAEGEEEGAFERFHRGAAGRRDGAGSGLGLTTARALARSWGGEARLRRRAGGGTVAVLEAPVAPASNAVAEQASSAQRLGVGEG